MQAAITQLEIYLNTLETNAPINEAEGNFEQATLEYKNAQQVREALECLKEHVVTEKDKIEVGLFVVGLLAGALSSVVALLLVN